MRPLVKCEGHLDDGEGGRDDLTLLLRIGALCKQGVDGGKPLGDAVDEEDTCIPVVALRLQNDRLISSDLDTIQVLQPCS